MAKSEFLKTEQKNEHIQFTNFDMSHWNEFTTNLGEIRPTLVEPILPNDSADLVANDEIICQALENPSFSKFKLCHKAFYMPNTVLWKYWDQFITNKPSYTWTNSAIQDFIDNTKPFTVPYFTWADILPIIAFARGFFKEYCLVYSPTNDYSTDQTFYYSTSDGKKIEITDIQNSRNYIAQNVDSTGLVRPLRIIGESNQFSDYDQTGFYTNTNVFTGTNILDYRVSQLSSIFSYLKNSSDNSSFSGTQQTNFKHTCRPYILFQVSQRQCSSVTIEKRPFLKSNVEVSKIGHLKVDSSVLGSQFDPIADSDIWPILQGSTQGSLQDFIDTYYEKGYYILPLPPSFEASQYNLTPAAYLWYLCNNAVKLLDSFGIPVYQDRLYYNTEKFDALPFFAYSKIYHEFFADKQLQVNCPDWREANGPLCPNDSDDDPSLHYFNGWILHHPEIPYNIEHFNFDEKLVIRNPHMGRHLLLGIDLNNMLFNSSLNPHTQFQYDRSNKPLSHTYMNYNGLLHLQFSNFPPDYFTEVLLDPMAGAKDIQIPTTITQLQEKSKLQDFLNQTAWTRNIKEWLQSQWSAISHYTTVTDPSLCGSCDVDINISQVLQTSETNSTPLGTRAGVGSGYGHGKLVDRQFGEYGWLINVSYVVLDTIYVNRLDVRQRHKSSRFDYPLPQFANLGNEQVKQSEIQFVRPQQLFISLVSGNDRLYYTSSTPVVPGFKASQPPLPTVMRNSSVIGDQTAINSSTPNTLSTTDLNNAVFGYIPRYSIYKHHMDEVHGDFLTTLKRWVPTREFTFRCLPNYCFISYELASETCGLLKNFVNMDTFGNDNFLINQRNIFSMRRALPYIVKPQL